MLELPVSPRGRRYGAIPSKKDHRDKSLLTSRVKPQSAFPPSFSILQFCGPIKNQGQQGSCTGHASASLAEFIWRRDTSLRPILSPSFIYYLERQIEGTLDQGDVGAQVRSSVQVINQYGVCLLNEMGYSDADFSTAPSSNDMLDGPFYHLGAYHSVGNNILAMKSCVLSNQPFVIGISVYDSFESDAAMASGLIPYPNVTTENLLGGHEVLCGIAYDDTVQCPNAPNPGAFRFQNSWGNAWGLGGDGWMPYDYLADTNLTSDVWAQGRI
jgi:C1A family cysteine protease